MSNKKGDVLWGLFLLIWVFILAVPSFRDVFIKITGEHPYMGGFVKFFILATMGDLLGVRILKSKWLLPTGFFYKACLWGLLGMAITLIFTVFSGGAGAAQATGMLPFDNSKPAHAIFTSTLMNLTFGPMMYIYHKFGDLYIEAVLEKKGSKITVQELIHQVDWVTMVSFSWLKTCLLIWIPLHTLVFLLPPEYRVLASAFLSILLGILISISKKDRKKSVAVVQSA
jgi:hypothetical protein